jgi:quercetin dioxygenase-like cupin family protein
LKLITMIVKKENTKNRQFKGVSFEILAVGLKSMVTKMNYEFGNNVPLHSHPNEQSGYVISGKHIIHFQNMNEILGPGDSYSIPENIKHSWEVIEGGEVIDVFTPPRQDYL